MSSAQGLGRSPGETDVTENTDPPFPADEAVRCPVCLGTGGHPYAECVFPDVPSHVWGECEHCDGHGVIHKPKSERVA
jgi:hypothetical protein